VLERQPYAHLSHNGSSLSIRSALRQRSRINSKPKPNPRRQSRNPIVITHVKELQADRKRKSAMTKSSELHRRECDLYYEEWGLRQEHCGCYREWQSLKLTRILGYCRLIKSFEFGSLGLDSARRRRERLLFRLEGKAPPQTVSAEGPEPSEVRWRRQITRQAKFGDTKKQPVREKSCRRSENTEQRG
jgi:hypothetical protein